MIASGLGPGTALGLAPWSARAWSGLLGWLAPAIEPAAGDDPFAMFAGWDSSKLMWLAVLVPVAVLVFFVGSRRFRQQLGSGSLVPRGRDRVRAWGGSGRRDTAWRATVERLEDGPVTEIASARNGPVRLHAEIVDTSGHLGGAPGRECVWRNRAGAGPQTAVGAELIFVADATGRCAVEQLEGARVIAPTDLTGQHYESVSLCVGDRVELLGTFEHDVVGEHEDPTRLIYGTLGADGRLEVRVLQRPPPPSPDEPDDEAPSNDEASPSPDSNPASNPDEPDADATDHEP